MRSRRIVVGVLLLATVGCAQDNPQARRDRVIGLHGAQIRSAVVEMLARDSLELEAFDLRRSVVIWEDEGGVDLRLPVTRVDGCVATLAVMGTHLDTSEPEWIAQATPQGC